jgi:hypothetical protein
LQARLQEAGATFRAEQDRQQFSGRPKRAAIDVFGQLLRPCLGLDTATAAGPTSAFFGAGAGVRVPSVPSLIGLVETLLTPPVERDPLGEPVVEPDLAPATVERFGERAWRDADALLPARGRARRLSELLAEARELDPELPTLVALRVVHAVGSSVGTARGQGDPTVLLAFDDGTVLRDPEFGGADLLVTSAGVSAGEPGIEEVA